LENDIRIGKEQIIQAKLHVQDPKVRLLSLLSAFEDSSVRHVVESTFPNFSKAPAMEDGESGFEIVVFKRSPFTLQEDCDNFEGGQLLLK